MNKRQKDERMREEGRHLSLYVPVEAQCSRKLRFQPSARPLQSSNALGRIDSGFGMVVNCKGLSCFSVCLTLIPQMHTHTLRFPLPFGNSKRPFSSVFVSRGHGRAASLGTVAVSMGPRAGNQRNSKQRERACVNRRLAECISIWSSQH